MSNKFPAPIQLPGLYCVGFVRSAHGLRGELFLGLFAARADWLDQATELHLLRPRQTHAQTFSLQGSSAHKDGLIVRLEGISDRTAAEAFKPAHVYIPEAWLVSEPGEPIFLRQIEGFELHDASGVVLGQIVDFSSNGSQDLLVIEHEGRRGLVPFVEDFLLNIDFDKRHVRMDLPPGLLEL